MSDVFNFLGGPLNGQTMAVPDGRWPMAAHEMLPGGRGIGRGGMEGWAPAYRTVQYYPVRWDDGTQFAITEDHMQRARVNGGLDDGLVKEFALRRLYEAITGDHNNPTDESGDELEAAIDMAQKVIEAPVATSENERFIT